MKVCKVNNAHGYTLVELLICLAGLGMLGLAIGGFYVVFHFLAKLW